MARPTTRSQIEQLVRRLGPLGGVPLADLRAAFPGPTADAAILDLLAENYVFVDHEQHVVWNAWIGD